jgi:uncharacterized membrane protein YciS (DUF1049 family)
LDPELTGFALGLLLGAAKVMTIGTIGFAIAWWRGRQRIRSLEADLREAENQVESLTEERDALMERQADAGPLLEPPGSPDE